MKFEEKNADKADKPETSQIANADEVATEKNGGQTTISPPANFRPVGQHGEVMASGVDKIHLAVDAYWSNEKFFNELEKLKQEAVLQDSPMPGWLENPACGDFWLFNVQPYGLKGYDFALQSREYFVKVGRWLQPKSRPSVMIEIHSETLWLTGAIEAVDRILSLLKAAGATNVTAKASRIDLCLDLRMPAAMFTLDLLKHRTTRAIGVNTHMKRDNLTGISFGKGTVSAKMYDKPREIAEVSHKEWMFDIWGTDYVAENERIVRIEFQLLREGLIDLAVNSIWDFTNHPRNLWGYCTQSWLKFQDDPKAQPRDQITLPWWRTVQNGFLGLQKEHPMIRAKIVNADRKQISQQLLGQFTSLLALESKVLKPQVCLADNLTRLVESAQLIGMTDEELSKRVGKKLAKYIRLIQKFKDAEELRKALGLPLRQKESA